MGKASRVPFSERGGRLRGVLDLATGRYPSFLFGGSTDRLLPVFHLHEVTRAVLEPRLQFLAEHGYRTVTTDAIARLVRDGRHPGPFTVALCFDDARASLWTVAMPMLRKYNFCAITYAIPGRIVDADATRPTLDDGGATAERADLSDRPFVTWPELRALQAGGLVDVQNHTYSHASVFCADRVTGFVTPEFASTHLLDRPQISQDGEPTFLQPDDLGAPLYAQRSRMSDAVRYVEDMDTRDRCLTRVREEGGAAFFAQQGWQRTLQAIANGERGGVRVGRYAETRRPAGARPGALSAGRSSASAGSSSVLPLGGRRAPRARGRPTTWHRDGVFGTIVRSPCRQGR